MFKAADKMKMTIDRIESVVWDVIVKNERGVTVESVEPYDGDYCTVILDGSVTVSTLNAIAKAVGGNPIVDSEESNKLSLFFRIPDEDSVGTGDDDGDEREDGRMLSIPDRLRHEEEFYDSRDMVIPGTEVRCSNTEQNAQIMAWMKETGHYPIMYIRLDDGVHAEVSSIYDRKVTDVLERGEAVGGDGRKFKIEHPDEIFPICGSICVRATCIETGRSDAYGLDFFA